MEGREKKGLITIDEKDGLEVRTDGWTHGWSVDKYSWPE